MPEPARGSTVLALWQKLSTPAAEGLVREAHAGVTAARSAPGVLQFEFYRNDEDATTFMLYAQFADRKAGEPFLRFTGEAERSHWTNVAALTGIPGTSGEPGAEARHVTLVRMSLKVGALPKMIEACSADMQQTSGVKRFDFNNSETEPQRFMICARWVDRAAWESHNAGPEYLAMAKHMGELHDGAPYRLLWKPVETAKT